MRLRSGKIIHPNGIHINITNTTNNLKHSNYGNRNKSLDCVFDTIKISISTIENNKHRFPSVYKFYWINQCNVIMQLYNIMNEYYHDIYKENENRPGTIKLLNIAARKALRLLSDISHIYNKHSTPLMKYKIIGEFNHNECVLFSKCIKLLISYIKKSRENDLLKIIS